MGIPTYLPNLYDQILSFTSEFVLFLNAVWAWVSLAQEVELWHHHLTTATFTIQKEAGKTNSDDLWQRAKSSLQHTKTLKLQHSTTCISLIFYSKMYSLSSTITKIFRYDNKCLKSFCSPHLNLCKSSIR